MSDTTPELTPSENLAALLIELFAENEGVPFTKDEALTAVGVDPEDTIPGFRGVMRRVRKGMAKIGLLVPPAVPAAGHRYLATSDPAQVFEGILHVSRTSRGLDQLNAKLLAFVLSCTEWCAENPALAKEIRRTHDSLLFKIQNDHYMVADLEELIAATQ